MQSYIVPAWAERQIAKVGWNQQWGSYWFVVYKLGPYGETAVADPDVTYTMGVNDPFRRITNLGDLLMYSWGEIMWESPQGLYATRALRDDPTFDALYGGELEAPADLEAFVIYALDSAAVKAANDAVRGHPLPPPPLPERLDVLDPHLGHFSTDPDSER